MRRQLPELDTFYYLDNFEALLSTIKQHYQFALDDQHKSFLDAYEQLERNARCLYVRIANRKARVFARNQLRYAEIENVNHALDDLIAKGLVTEPSEEHYSVLVDSMICSQLKSVLNQHLPPSRCQSLGVTGLKKAELVIAMNEHISFDMLKITGLADRWVQTAPEIIDYLLYLYFGKAHRGLNTFTMRDLGIARTQKFKRGFTPRFTDKETALASFHYATQCERIKAAGIDELITLSQMSNSWPQTDDPEVAESRHKALYQLGRKLERDKQFEYAKQVYSLSGQFPCSERLVRLLMKHTESHDEAESLLISMIDNPSSDEELLFAEDFYQLKFAKTKVGRLTKDLREAEVIVCDESGRGRPEATVVEALEGRGLQAFRSENRVWRQLFGLLFWDMLYGEHADALHSEFDIVPQDLAKGTFYTKREPYIEQRLSLLDDKPQAANWLLRIVASHYGSTNGIVKWRTNMLDRILPLVRLASKGSLATVLRAMAQDYTNSNHGFPDLMVINENYLKFIEVKAEGDQLKRHQLVQIERMRQAGISVEILRVEWRVDPMQPYVVIDVETTGGRAAGHRVTEIGAVKVVGDEVIGKYSTLVNPDRAIPRNITKLTGITNAMVRDAPRFSEVADDLREFIGDAVFVAHNVNFDYGFIREEYKRLDQTFYRPKLCTVSSARRYLKGHKSYSLGNLCRALDIPLENHHRALCDAEAAAQILMMVNSRRLLQTY